MKNQNHVWLRSLALALGVWIGIGTVTALAGPGPGGGFGGKIGSPSASSEVVTTSPLVAASGPGFVLEVEPNQVTEVLDRVRGDGSIQVMPARDGKTSIVFRGHFAIALSKEAVTEGQVRIAFRGEHTRVVERRGRLILLQR